MARILAIDYGTKRTGLAVSDDMQIIATFLTTVSTCDAIEFISNYVKQQSVEMIVIGNPKQINNTPSESAMYVNKFVDNLHKIFVDLPIYMIDERYTSKIASQTIANNGLNKKKRQQKELIDSVAAVLILQDFMKMRQNGIKIEKIYN